MSLSLLRNAVVTERLKHEGKLTHVKQAQQVLGGTLSEVVQRMNESYVPQKSDYEHWLSTINDLAKEEGVLINTKQKLASIAFTVLDDDPVIDAIGGDTEESKRAIINTLWAAFSAAKHHHTAQKHFSSTSSQEENEELHDSDTHEIHGDADGDQMQPEDHPRDGESYEDFVARTGNETHGTEHCIDAEEGHDDEESADGDQPDVNSSEESDDGDQDGTDVPEERDEFDLTKLLAAVIGDDDVFGLKDKLDKPKPSREEEEEKTKTLFRQAVTSPREHLTQAVKDIEDEGAQAVRDLSIPRNPHPKGSQAHKAFAKGMKNAVKSLFGIVDRPTAAPKKKR